MASSSSAPRTSEKRSIASPNWPAPATSPPKPCPRLWTVSSTPLLDSNSQRPAFAILFADQAIGFRTILRPQIHRVPLEFFAQAKGQVAEVIGFGQGAGVVEI